MALNQSMRAHAHRIKDVHIYLRHMTVVNQEPPLCQCAVSMYRLLRVNRGAFEGAGANSTQRSSVPLEGGDDNALLKYDTLPWHYTPTTYIPLYYSTPVSVSDSHGLCAVTQGVNDTCACWIMLETESSFIQLKTKGGTAGRFLCMFAELGATRGFMHDTDE